MVDALRAKLRVHRRELRLHRAVQHRIADRHARAADQIGVHGDRRLDFLAEALLERALQFGELRVASVANALSIVALAVASASFFSVSNIAAICGSSVDALAFDQHADEVARRRVEPVAADRQQQRFLRRRVEPRIVERLRRRARRATIVAAKRSISDHAGSACSSRASSNAASA